MSFMDVFKCEEANPVPIRSLDVKADITADEAAALAVVLSLAATVHGSTLGFKVYMPRAQVHRMLAVCDRHFNPGNQGSPVLRIAAESSE